MVGVYRKELLSLVGKALLALGRERVCVVHSEDGLDEASISGNTTVWFGTAQGMRREFSISPQELGLSPSPLSEIAGGDARRNAKIATEVLSGRRCAARDAVLLNASLAIYSAGRDGMRENLSAAAAAIDSGAAMGVVERLRAQA